MTFNRSFKIITLVVATMFGLGPQMAHAQQGVPVTLVGQMPGPSNNCSSGFIPFAQEEMRIGAAGDCLGQTGVWQVINSTTGCLALWANGSFLNVTVIDNGVAVTVGTHTDRGFLTCLPPGESAMFIGNPLGVRLTGQAFLSPQGVGIANGLRSFERGFPIITASAWAIGDNGAPMTMPSLAGGRCGTPGYDLVLNPAHGVRTVVINNFQCAR
jgi:hypothetical protein